MSHVIHAHHAERVVVAPATVVTKYFQAADLPGTSMAIVDLDGVHPRRENSRSTKMFYILDGFLTIRLATGPSRELAPGDAVMIRPGESHELEGKASFIAVCSPAYHEADERLVKG